MKLEFISNASVLFELSNGTTLLTDPWYTDGIYLGTLFNFPPLSEAQKARYRSLRPDYLYISHFHGDHLDPATLRHFSKDTPVLIGDYRSPALRAAVEGCGFTEVWALPFRQRVALPGAEVVLFPQFAAAGEDTSAADYTPVDTSLLLRDTEAGATAFFAVDNPIQVSDAADIRKAFGPIDVALLPYGGASVYPWAFDYSAQDKLQRAHAVRAARLDKFCQLAQALEARWAVPAAGSFLYGGKLAEQARYQLYAPPEQIRTTCQRAQLLERLRLLTTGDVLEVGSGSVRQAPNAAYRDYREEDRIALAHSLSGFPCPLDQVTLPSELVPNFGSLLRRARARMWQQQQALERFFPVDVDLVVTSSPGVRLASEPQRFRLALDGPELSQPQVPSERARLTFHMNAALLLSILHGSVFWNVAEYLMRIERSPDRHDVRLHQAMGYLRL